MIAPAGGALFDQAQVAALVERFFGSLTIPVRGNLVLMVRALLTLTAALRSGNGALTLAAIARALPLTTSFKQRYKRLNRFLDNHLFDPQGLTEGLFAVMLGVTAIHAMVPVILDQSAVGDAQLLLAGIPQAGRVLPLGLWVFTYEDIRQRPQREKSQNFLERVFLMRLLEATPAGRVLCFILDRGYDRLQLVRHLLAQPEAFFILRSKRNVTVQRCKRGRLTRTRLGSLRAPHGQPRRLERVRYGGSAKAVEVDVIIYWERGHKEVWYLVVPPGSARRVPDGEVVRLYRRRMHVEQGFRDFKTHLGVRGLQLQVRVSQRVERLLMAFTLAYALVVSLGMTRVAERARERLEDRRRGSRHGTDRILSVRTIAALLLGGLCVEFLRALARTIDRLVQRTLASAGLYYVALRL